MDEFDNPLGDAADGENAAGDGKESAASGAASSGGGGGGGGGGSSEARPSAAASGASFDDGSNATFDTEDDGNRSPGGTRIASAFAKGGHGLGEVAHGLGGLTGAATHGLGGLTGAATGGLTKGLGALQSGGTLFQELDEQELLDRYQTESSKPWYVIDPHGTLWKAWCFIQGVIACVVAAHPSACLPGCLRALPPPSSLLPLSALPSLCSSDLLAGRRALPLSPHELTCPLGWLAGAECSSCSTCRTRSRSV
eukprot:COSAG06_NODE_455_length_15521_cov_8.312022_5_plen_253_part_00